MLNTERVIDQQDELSGYRKAEKINRAMQNGNSESKNRNKDLVKSDRMNEKYNRRPEKTNRTLTRLN